MTAFVDRAAESVVTAQRLVGRLILHFRTTDLVALLRTFQFNGRFSSTETRQCTPFSAFCLCR